MATPVRDFRPQAKFFENESETNIFVINKCGNNFHFEFDAELHSLINSRDYDYKWI